jgi:hypothetical protein
VSVRLSATVPLTSTRTLTARLVGVGIGATNQVTGAVATFVNAFILMAGSEDPDVPPIWGSHATQIWQDSNRRLLLHRQQPDEWQMTVRELATRFSVTPAEPKVTLGGSLRLRSTRVRGALDVRFRFVEVSFALDDPGDTSFRVVSRLEEAMQLIDRRRSEGSSMSVAGGTILVPTEDGGGTVPTEPTTPPPGGVGGGGGRSIFIRESGAGTPTPNNTGDYVHQPDLLRIHQFGGSAWDRILETTRGDLRMALTRGGEMGALLALWEMQRNGWTVDDDGEEIRHYTGQDGDTIAVMVDGAVRYVMLEPEES